MAYYDLDDTRPGVRDCPRCKHTMQRLKEYNSIRTNEGYTLDYDNKPDWLTYVMFGWFVYLIKMILKHTIQPLYNQQRGKARQAKFDKIVQRFPNTLICPYCSYIMKRQ